MSLVCLDSLKFQGRTSAGVLQFDLVTDRAGSKFYVKPRMEPKDCSWKDSITSVVLQVIRGGGELDCIVFLCVRLSMRGKCRPMCSLWPLK